MMKKKFLHRGLSMLLAMAMLFTSAPFSVFSADNEAIVESAPTQTETPEQAPAKKNTAVDLSEDAVYTLEYENGYSGTAASGFQSGSGETQTDPYVIATGAQLKYFADQVNGGNSYSGKYIRLDDNIDFNGYTWTPVGVSAAKPFMGHFDGGNHEIRNLNIRYDSGKPADSEVFYIGFFGYVKNATVQNLGIDTYTLDQSYNYDTEIGGMVAHAAGTSKITNCYANGNIGATFEDANPLDRTDVIEPNLTAVTLNDSKPRGQGVIINLTGLSSSVNTTLTIGGDVSAVRLIGKAGVTYTGLNIVISGHSHFSLLIDLQNCSIQGNSKNGTIYCDNGRTVFIRNNEGNNTISSNSFKAINLPKSHLYLCGSGTLTVLGGNGTSATETSCNGTPGQTALLVNTLSVDIAGQVSLVGGTGGKGANGRSGNNGTPSYNGHSDRNAGGGGANGGNGGNGTPGGNGGAGGYAFNINTIYLKGGSLSAQGGQSGSGGNGGNGGRGGNGQEAGGWGTRAGNGGNGGNAGAGGNTYITRPAETNTAIVRDGGNYYLTNGAQGVCGYAGTPGAGGARGMHCDKANCGQWATWGDDGSPGAQGSTASNGKVITVGGTPSVSTQSISSWAINRLNQASLLVGGFVGVADNSSTIQNVACIVNNISQNNNIISKYAFNTVTTSNLVCLNQCSVSNALTAYESSGVIQKYPLETWFVDHADSGAESAASVLIDSTDSLGLVYDNGIAADNSVSQGRKVLAKTGQVGSIVIPDYVYSGKFITAVTEIASSAFEESQLLQSVTGGANLKIIGENAFKDSSLISIVTGNAVTEIGAEAFSGCTYLRTAVLGDSVSTIGSDLFAKSNLLESITFGKALVNIPDIANGKAPFGIDKSSSSLKSYTVAPENTAYRSIDGVLYELFKISDTQYVTAAVIDVPVRVPVKNYGPVDHVVKIYPNAFAHNKTVESVKLDYIRDIGEKAFFGATNLKTVVFGTPEEPDVAYITILDQEVAAGRVQYSQLIGINAFQDCTALESIDLESEFITKIGSGAFRNCATKAATPLKITLGKNITSISANYDELYNNKQNGISEDAVKNFFSVFEGANIQSFAVVDGNIHYTAIDGVLYLRTGVYENGKENIWLIAYPKNKPAVLDAVGNHTAFHIPAPADMAVTRISKSAFSGVENLRYLQVDNGVVTVDNGAFTNAKLYSITFGSAVQHIGTTPTGTRNIFNGCSNLVSLYVDPANAFYSDRNGVLYNQDQTELIKYPQAMSGREFTVPDTVHTVLGNAFSKNELLRRVTFSSQITNLGNDAFNGCSNMSVIYFKSGAAPFLSRRETMDSGAFETSNARTIVCYSDEDASWNAISGIYETDEGHKLFSIEKFAGFPTDKMDTGYYAVVVVDKSGAPINDIHVTLGETVKTQDGIAMFYDLSYGTPYKLRAVDDLGQYFPLENAEFYPDEDTRITYLTLSSVPQVSGVSVSYDVEAADQISEILTDAAGATLLGDGHKTVDMNSETAKINTWCVDAMEILVNCGMDTDVNVVGFRLVQNGKERRVVTDPAELSRMITYKEGAEYGNKRFGELKIAVDTSRFETEQDVYIVVDFSDGNQVQTKLNIHIFELNFYNLNLDWLGQGLKLEVSKELTNILQGFGNTLEILPMGSDKNNKWHPEISINVEPDSFQVVIGAGKEWSKGPDESYDSVADFRKNWKTFCNQVKNRDLPWTTPYEYSRQRSTELNLSGFFEMKYKGLDENGNKDFQYEAGFIGTISFAHSFGATVTVVVVPVRVEYELSAEGTLIAKLVFDREAEQFCTPDLSVELKGKFEVRAGVGCKVFSVGVYGSAELVLVIDIAPDPGVDTLSLTGDVGLYVKYDGLFVKWKKTWSILKGLGVNATWVIYEDGKWWYESDGKKMRLPERTLTDALYDESSYEIAVSSFDAQAETFALTGIGDIQENAYSGITPQMLQIGDLVYIVYHDDLNGYSDSYDAYNYQKLVYQIYDTKAKTLSDVFVLDDNGFSDGAYQLYQKDDRAVIVYSQLNKKLTSNSLEDMSGYLGSLEIKTALLENGSFVAADTTLTNDTYYDMSLRIGEINGQITAVWVRNAENTMFSTDNGNMSVWYSIFDGALWSDPVCLKDSLGTITDIEVGDRGIAYITDTNNDLTTVGSARETEGYNDRKITVLDMSGNVILQTAEEAAYHDISYFGSELVYYVESNLYSIDTLDALFDAAIPELPESYTLLTDSTGNVKAILFIGTVVYDKDTGADGSNVFGIFCDGDAWGLPIQLTDFGADIYVSAFDAVDFGDNMLLSVLLSNVTYLENASDEYDNYTTTNSFTTVHVAYPTSYTMGDILFDPATVVPNTKTTLDIAVTNNGYQTISGVPVTVTRPGNTTFTATATTFYDAEGNALAGGLLSGTTGYIKVTFDPEDADPARKYTVSINGQTQELQLWYSDFAVFGKQVLIGDTYYIVTRVTNNGYVRAAYTLTAEIGDAENPDDAIEKLAEYTTNQLAHGETQYFTTPLSFTPKGDGSDLIFVRVNADDEYIQTNNAAKVNTATDGITEVSTESLSIWISETDLLIDRDQAKDHALTFSKGYTLVSATIDEASAAGLYTLSGDVLTVREAAIARKYPNGTHYMRLQFTDGSVDAEGNLLYKYATVKLSITQYFQVQWVLDGNVLAEETYEAGALPAQGDPAKEKDAQYTYEFIGWDRNGDGIADALAEVTSNTTYTALFSKTLNTYTVHWNIDGILSSSESYTYGSVPEYKGTPVKSSSAQYDYVFAGWDQALTAVTGDVTYTAVFDAVLRKYTVTTIVDGTQTTMQVEYGTTPVLPDVTKQSDLQNHYTFTGWSPAISPVYGDQTYTAQFTSTLRQYTVTWNIDGTETKVLWDYGMIPAFDGTPSKPSSAQYAYAFTGWDKEIVPVTGDVTYTATFDETLRNYSIVFVVDGTAYSETYAYGTMPEFTGETNKMPDETYRYVFTGWDQALTAVTGDATYTAQYEAILLGSATVTNTAFDTAWNCQFTTTVSLADVQNMTGTTISLHYDPLLVTLRSYRCGEGVRVLAEETGHITLEVTGLSQNDTRDLLTLTFLTSNCAPVGQTDFLAASCVDKLTTGFGKLRLYQMGDVNMDGRINTVDAAMVQRYSVQKLSLTEVQKVYANVSEDHNEDGTVNINTVDAAMIQQYAVRKLNALGMRITVTLVDASGHTTAISLVRGNDLAQHHQPEAGYAWSLSKEQYSPVDFKALTADTTVYLVKQ